MGVRQHIHDIRGCPCVSVSTQRMSVAVHQYTYQHVGPWTQHAGPSHGLCWVILAHVGCLFSTHRTSVAVRVCPCVSVSTHMTSVAVHQYTYHHYTQDIRVCPSAHTGRLWLSLCVRVCPSAHTERLWLSISALVSTLVLGLSTLALPVVCLGDFGTWAVCSVHTGRLWMSASTHRTSVAVCGCPSAHKRRSWLSVCVRLCPSAHTGRPWLSISTHISTLALPVDYSAHTGHPWLSECFRVCQSAHTGRPWLSISTHISTLVLGLNTLTIPVDCSGDFCPRRLSVQYTHRTSMGVRQRTQDVRVCPSEHTGRPWLSVCVRVFPSAHIGCPWQTISTHISTLVLGLSTLTLPVYCSGDFGPRGLSVQYTQDVHGCSPEHTGCPWLSVCVRLCPSAQTGRQWLSISTHISTLVLGLNMLALPVDCLGDFGPRVLSVYYTHDVRGCPPPHTRCPWLSVAFRQHTPDVRGGPCVSMCFCVCPCVSVCVRVCRSAHTRRPWVSVSTHRTSVCVRQHTHDVCGCPCVSVFVRVSLSANTGRPWLSISTYISTLVLGLSTLALPMDCLGDFGPRRLSVQYTQDVCGCPCVSVCVRQHTQNVRGCPCVSVCVRQHTQNVRGCQSVHISARWPFPWTVWVILANVGCLFSIHRTSVGVGQHTHDVCGCLWLSFSTHKTFMAVRVGPCVSVCVRQHTQDVRGRPSVHISARWSLDSAHWPFLWTVRVILAHVGCLFSTHRTSVGVRQHRLGVHGCLSAHTGHPWLSVCVRVCPSAHKGRPWLSISTHISTLVLGLSTLTFPVDCSGDFGPRGLSVQYTQDIRGCPCVSVCVRQHTQDVRGCPCVSVCIRQHTQNVRGCPSVHISARWPFPWTLWVILANVGCLFSTHRTSLGVGQHTHDVCGCLWLSVSTHKTFVAVRVCLSAHTRRPWLSISTHISTLVLGLSMLALPMDCLGDFGPCGLSVQYTQDVRGCPTLALPMDCLGDFGPPGLSIQYTQDIRVCPSAHTGRLWLSLCVRVCPSTHTERLWLSISALISTLVLGLSTLALPVVCLGDFGPRGLSVQYTQDVCGCRPAHTGRPWLSVAVRQHTQDVRGCPCVSVCVRQHTQDGRGCPSVHISARWPFQWTIRDVCGCPSAHTGRPWLSECFRVCQSAHTGRPWLSISTHISTLVLGLNTLTIPVDCSDDFCPRRLSVQYTHRTSVGVRQRTQDVRVCPSEHTGRPWLSVCVHVFPSAHIGCPWQTISTHISTLVLGLSTLTLPVYCSGDFGPRGLSVQYTQDVHGCPPEHTGCPWLSVCVRLCPSAHTGRPWLSISTHISTLVLGLNMLALPVDCLDDFGPRVLSVFYTHDVRGCPPPHTRRPWLSVAFRQQTPDVRGCPCVSMCVCVCPCVSVCVGQHTHDVRGCPSAHTGPHTGRPWLSISTDISTLVLGLSTLALPMDSLGDFGPCGLSVQYTQDVCGCPCVYVCVRQHTQNVRGCPSVHISSRWPFPWTVWVILANVGCLFSTHRTSVGVGQHTHDVCGCLWLSVSTHKTFVAVRVCLCVSVCVRQHTQEVRGCPSIHISARWSLDSARWSLDSARWPFPWTVRVILAHVGCLFSTHRTSVGVCQHRLGVHGCPSAHTGHPWLSVCVRVCPSAHKGRPWLSISTHISTLVLGLSTLTFPVDCSGDFGPRGLSVQYTQTSVAVLVCPCVSVSTHRTSVAVLVCPCVSVSTHRTFVAVHQCTYQHAGPSRGLFGTHKTFVAVRVCLSAHTRRPWLSISTHISTLVLGLSMLALPMDCLGDFGPCGLSVQYTQDVRGCPTLALPMDCLGDFGPPGLSIQYTQDIRVCPSAHTGRLWLSLCVRVCPSTHTERLWLSISALISTLVLGLSTLALPVVCLGDFGPRGLSVQYTQDVCGCRPAHTGRPWLSVAVRQHTQDVRGCPCVSVCVRQHTQDGRGCPSVHISARWPFQWTIRDVCGCPSAHTGRPWLSQCFRVCQSAHTGRPWLSISTHISTLVLGLNTLTIPVDCSGDFCPRRMSVQYTQRTSVGVRQRTQDVRVCPSEHTGRPWLSVCVRVFPSAHIGCPWQTISTHISTLVLGLSMVTLPVYCSGDFGPRGLSVQYTQDVHGCPPEHTGCPWLSVCVRLCPSAHTGRPWLSISTHISTLVLGLNMLALPVDCLDDFGPRVLSVFYTHDVRGCPPPHTRRPWLSVAFRQQTPDVRGCPCVSMCVCVCPCVSVCVGQHTHDVRGCPSAHTGPHTGRPWLSISTDISTLVLGLSTLALPMDSLGDFGPCGLSVQYTQDVCGCPCVYVCVRQHTQNVRGCPSVHISSRWPFPWTVWVILANVGCLFSTHRTSVGVGQHTHDVCGCLWLTHRRSVAVHQYTYQHAGPWTQHAGPWTQHAGPSRGLFGTDWASMGVSANTGHPCGCPCVSVCVRSAHKGNGPWLSISTISARWSLDLSTLTLPVDCSGDFGPRGLSVQYTQDVRGCPCVSVCVRQHTQDVRGCPCVSVCVRQHTQNVRGCPSVHISGRWPFPWTVWVILANVGCLFSTHRTSLGVGQHTHDVCGCLCWTAVAVHSVHMQQPGRFGTQHTGTWSPHTGRPWVSVSTYRTSVAVRVCPLAHKGRPWLSISTHISTLVLGLSTLTLPVDCSGDFGPRGLSVQYTQDIPHTGRMWLSISTHISTLVLGVSTLTLPVDCSGDFGPRGLSIQYTQDVSHTGRPWLSISTHISTLALPVDCLGDFGPRGLSVLYTQDDHLDGHGLRKRTSQSKDIKTSVPGPEKKVKDVRKLRLNLIQVESQLGRSAPLAKLLAHSAEAAGSQLISVGRTVRILVRWSGSGPVAGHGGPAMRPWTVGAWDKAVG
ncbi:hypothetical protein IGI04_036918 [Brassica rapa subsp. trilocularis]|uniref:Uncharacterized protein n=1 Tax=Brassica rapa subsp. trilocularis TaxID=1813537 RepID=A0ABQ7LFX2_BRACM|nr:hypothetical protein IGI04_036918 [Brassica rapa subsp. trilocularis]